MKTLVLVRHAKSSWDAPGLSDFDRPLNERGKKDAPEMAERLKEKGLKPDVFLSSPAKRARRTARYFAEAFGVEKEAIVFEEDLYMATEEAFLKAVRGRRDGQDTVVLFAHNPGITEFANTLSNVRIDDMPTCSMFAVAADVKSWEDFLAGEKKFLFFDYPKNPLS